MRLRVLHNSNAPKMQPHVIDVSDTCRTRETALRWLSGSKGKPDVYLVVRKMPHTDWLFYDPKIEGYILFIRGLVCVQSGSFDIHKRGWIDFFHTPLSIAEFYSENVIHHCMSRKECSDMWWILNWRFPKSTTTSHQNISNIMESIIEPTIVCTEDVDMPSEKQLLHDLSKRVGKNVGDVATKACLESLGRIVFDFLDHNGKMSDDLTAILKSHGWYGGFNKDIKCQPFMRDLDRLSSPRRRRFPKLPTDNRKFAVDGGFSCKDVENGWEDIEMLEFPSCSVAF